MVSFFDYSNQPVSRIYFIRLNWTLVCSDDFNLYCFSWMYQPHAKRPYKIRKIMWTCSRKDIFPPNDAHYYAYAPAPCAAPGNEPICIDGTPRFEIFIKSFADLLGNFSCASCLVYQLTANFHIWVRHLEFVITFATFKRDGGRRTFSLAGLEEKAVGGSQRIESDRRIF